MFSSKPVVFISYSRKDKEKVATFARGLARSGVRTWLDTQDIIGGEWRREIKKGLRHSNFFIACLSKNTEERGEVLQFEYDSALEIQKEMLEGEVYIVPVRLEPCEIPDCLRHLQCLDNYDPTGWDNLIRVLRSKSRPRPVLAISTASILALILSVLGVYMFLRSSPESELLASRVQGKSATARSSVQLGVTLWKMEPSNDSDPPSVREIVHPQPAPTSQTEQWTPVRLPSGGTFRLGDYFQVGIESSRIGYLYVFNRSFRKDGSAGPASLIFPTGRIREGDNQIWPGKMIRLPDRASHPPYWEFKSQQTDYAGELLFVLLAPHPIEGIDPQENSVAVPDNLVEALERQYGEGVRRELIEAKQLRLTVEEADARDRNVQLPGTALAPQFIFEAKRGSDTAMLGTLTIAVGAEP